MVCLLISKWWNIYNYHEEFIRFLPVQFLQYTNNALAWTDHADYSYSDIGFVILKANNQVQDGMKLSLY